MIVILHLYDAAQEPIGNLIFITGEGKIKVGRMLGFPRFTVVIVDFWKGGGVRNKMANDGREKLRCVNIIVKIQRETV